MTDTTLRQLKILEILPRQPFKKSPQNIKENLTQLGFEVSIRTIQRDLKVLSGILPFASDEKKKPMVGLAQKCSRIKPTWTPKVSFL